MVYFVDDSFNAFKTFVALYRSEAIAKHTRLRYLPHFLEIIKLKIKPKQDVVVLDFIFSDYVQSTPIFSHLEEMHVPVILYSSNSLKEVLDLVGKPLPNNFRYIQKSGTREVYDYINKLIG